MSHSLFHDACECLGPSLHLGGGIWNEFGFNFGGSADEKIFSVMSLETNSKHSGYGRGKLSSSINQKEESVLRPPYKLEMRGIAIGPVAQWIRHRPTEPGIAGSSPAGVISVVINQTIARTWDRRASRSSNLHLEIFKKKKTENPENIRFLGGEVGRSVSLY